MTKFMWANLTMLFFISVSARLAFKKKKLACLYLSGSLDGRCDPRVPGVRGCRPGCGRSLPCLPAPGATAHSLLSQVVHSCAGLDQLHTAARARASFKAGMAEWMDG